MPDPSNPSPAWMAPDSPILVGVSSCLLGEPVRWDGAHKLNAYLQQELSNQVRWVPVCPEVGIGLSIPRPPIQLVQAADRIRAMGVTDRSLDVTERLSAYGKSQVDALRDLSAYVFKSKSPSCGLERVKVHGPHGGRSLATGVGVYASEWKAACPELPMEDEERLRDVALRDNFLERLFAYRRWQAMVGAGFSPERLVLFHGFHKYALMAHGAAPAKRLGRIVAEAGTRTPSELQQEYFQAFMGLLKRKATSKQHANVLQHLMGYLKRGIRSTEKAELTGAIEAYRLEQVPRNVPLNLLRRQFQRHPHPYVAGQTYLYPEPAERRLRGLD